MTQSFALTRARVPAFAIGALGLVALATMTLPRAAAPAVPDTKVFGAPAATLVQRPLVETMPVTEQTVLDKTGCVAGAYVTGDLAGDASPATVYATMCGSR